MAMDNKQGNKVKIMSKETSYELEIMRLKNEVKRAVEAIQERERRLSMIAEMIENVQSDGESVGGTTMYEYWDIFDNQHGWAFKAIQAARIEYYGQ